MQQKTNVLRRSVVIDGGTYVFVELADSDVAFVRSDGILFHCDRRGVRVVDDDLERVLALEFGPGLLAEVREQFDATQTPQR